jgi:hypothetical protein
LLEYTGNKRPTKCTLSPDTVGRYTENTEELKRWGLEQIIWCGRLLYSWMKVCFELVSDCGICQIPFQK